MKNITTVQDMQSNIAVDKHQYGLHMEGDRAR